MLKKGLCIVLSLILLLGVMVPSAYAALQDNEQKINIENMTVESTDDEENKTTGEESDELSDENVDADSTKIEGVGESSDIDTDESSDENTDMDSTESEDISESPNIDADEPSDENTNTDSTESKDVSESPNIDADESLNENTNMDSTEGEDSNESSEKNSDETPNEETLSNEEEQSLIIKEVSETSTADAPENYVPAEDANVSGISVAREVDPSLPRVLLIQDTLPWSSNANETILSQLGVGYEKTTTAKFMENVELEQYGVVIFANDQRFSAYKNYEDFKEYLEVFAEVGGVIVFGACDNGWADGVMTADLPGGVEKSERETYHNYISDPLHPIVTGELSDYEPLLDADLVSGYCSHTYFVEDTLPAGSRVILRDSTNDAPTLVEYPLKNGRVIASGLTWEHAYTHAGQSVGGQICGEFAVKALEDLFLYAIRVSNIQVGELGRLKEYRLDANAHHIIVADSENIVADSDRSAIKGATVTVDGTDYTTNENGSVAIKDFGRKAVKISAPGYKTIQLTYTLEAKTARMFFLEKADTLKLPYITSLQDVNNEYDFMSQKVYYPEGKEQTVTIKMTAEWQGKTPAEYVLFQTDENGEAITKLVNTNGDFVVSPGTYFKPGYDVKARLYASDGISSKEIRTGIVIQENTTDINVGNVENLKSFRLFEDTTSTLNDNNVTKVYPSTWSVKIDPVPIEFKGEYDPKDGSYTRKFIIGLAGANEVEDLLSNENGDTEWWTFKSKLEEAKKLYSSREELFKKYKNKLADSKLTSQIKGKFEILGYYEDKHDAFGNLIERAGGALVKASSTGTQGGTFMLLVPVYYEIGLSVKIDGSFELNFTCVDDIWTPNIEGSLSFTAPEITLGIGGGVYGVLQAGVEGGGGLKMDIAPEWKGTLEASASFKVKVIFLGEKKWQIGDKLKYPLWPKEKTYSFADMYRAALEDGDVILEPISDEYAKYTTPWNVARARDVLQDWVMPDTMPELVVAGDQMIALFQTNLDGTIKLVYSVYDESTGWTTPEPVADDDTYDTYFKPVRAANGDVYVTWQKLVSTDAATDAEDGIEDTIIDAISNSEIYVAKWSAGMFGEAVRLTNDAYLDMLPRMASNGNTVVAAWVKDRSNDYMGGETGEIWYSTNSGSGWSEPWRLTTANGSVSDFAVGFVGSNIVACYIVDDTLYSSANNQPIATDGESLDNGISYYEGAFYWCNGGRVYTYSGNSAEAYTSEDIAVGSNYRIVGNDNKTAVVWAVNKSDETETANCGVLYASIDLGDHWSQPIEVFSDEGYSISYFDAHIGMDGTWYTMIDAVSDADGVADGEKTSLLFHHEDSLSDIKLDYAYAPEIEREGTNQPLYISVINLGDTPVTQLKLSITGGPIDIEKILMNPIEPGATDSITINLDVSNITSRTTLKVSVDAGNESNYSNNDAEVVIGLVDAAVDLKYYFNEDSVIVAAKVSNNGNIPMEASLSVIEDDENGIVIDVKQFENPVAPSEDVLYLYTFDTSEIDFKKQSSKNYVFRVDTREEDYNELNNSEIAIIYNENYVYEEPDFKICTVSFVDQLTGETIDSRQVTKGAAIGSLPTAPNHPGYTFDGWYTAPEGGSKVNTETTITQNTVIYALWIKEETTSRYTITVIASPTRGGDVTGSGTYDEGESVTVQATAASGYRFVHWTEHGQQVDTSAKYTFNITKERTLTAVFERISSDTSPGSSGGGSSRPAVKQPNVTTPTTPMPSSVFSDVPSNHPFATEIAWARDNGIMSGYSDGSFRPDNNTNRQQMWMVLARMAGANPTNMAEAQMWAINSGISDGTNPENPMSRQQLVTMLYRFAQSQGVSISGSADLSTYPDNDVVASYATEALAWAVGNGIVTGTTDGRLNPEGTATRAHFAAFLYRYSNP